MALKKRKTPISELWPERESLRIKPISNKPLTNNFKTNENSTDYRRRSIKSA